ASRHPRTLLVARFTQFIPRWKRLPLARVKPTAYICERLCNGLRSEPHNSLAALYGEACGGDRRAELTPWPVQRHLASTRRSRKSALKNPTPRRNSSIVLWTAS